MLEIKNLTIRYPHESAGSGDLIEDVDGTIVKNVSFQAKKGEVIVIAGDSGSGKSSIIKAINGILPFHQPAEITGDIFFNGESIIKKDIQSRSQILCTVFQNPNNQFYCVNSTDEMAFPLENRNIDKEEILRRIDEHTSMLKTTHLKDRNLMKMSGGQKQLVAITSVSVMDEDIYLLDEPSASLDEESIQHLAYAIKKWKEVGKIVIIAEHRLYYLKDIYDRLLVIERGEITESPQCTHLRSFEKITIEDLIKKHSYVKVNTLAHACFEEMETPGIPEEECSANRVHLLDYKYSYDKSPVLDLNLSLSCGKITFIIGKNGVGKTTLTHCLCGLKKKFKGKTTMENLCIDKKGYNHAALVMQDVNYQLFTESVYEEIKLATAEDEKIMDVLEKLNLADKKEEHPMSLSGGQKQRLAIGNAWAGNKKIIVFDEPTSGLCYKNMYALKSIFEDIKKSGKKVIVITHDYEFIHCFDDEEIVHLYK